MYTIGENNELISLNETPYARELDLQEALADHPELLAGHQMNPISPRRFVLATSEAGIAISEVSGNVFSLDLLFIDQDGVPTLVEVKRSSDTRLRREVIGQLLEYAANVLAFWSSDKIRSVYETTCAKRRVEPVQHLADRFDLASSYDYEDFWQLVKANLERQQLRLILVADSITTDTLRIIEYLNRQMSTTDVFAVVIPQYAGGAMRAIAPRVLNPSLVEVDRKAAASSSRRGEQWTRERFYSDLERRTESSAVATFSTIEEWALSRSNVIVDFGRGVSGGSMQISCNRQHEGSERPGDVVFLTLWSYGTAEVEFQYLASKEPFGNIALREELRDRLNTIDSISILSDKVGKRPNIPWQNLASSPTLQAFLAVQDWIVEQFLETREPL